jgi:hypothetical protein
VGDATILHLNDSVSLKRNLHVVRDNNHGGPGCVEFVKYLHDFLA